MKLAKLLSLAVAFIIGISACDKKEDPKRILEPNTPILVHLRSAQSLRAETTINTPTTRTIEECMKRLNTLVFYPAGHDHTVNLGISEENKLYDKHAIKVYSDYIINEKGELVSYFIDGHDFVFYDATTPEEIVGYIPNSVMQEASRKIKAAYAAGNYEEVYRLLQDAFIAYPITDAGYQALKAEGNN